MDLRLLSVLERHNPWLGKPEKQPELLAQDLPDPFLPRKKEWWTRAGTATLVVGPRQAGKTTWIRHSLSLQKNPVLLLHAEEPAIRELCQSPAEALNALDELMEPETILLLEEIQHLEDAQLFIKGLVDLQPNRVIIATGSSSFQFRSKMRESLAGRARRLKLFPFSLEELTATLPKSMLPALREKELQALWERILVFGAYPKPWFEKKPAAELAHLVEAFVLKDVSDLQNIENPAAFRKLLELSAADIGNLVNLSEWSSHALVSRPTASRYLDIAADAHIIRLLPPFVGGKRSEITGRPKAFFLDNGLRNVVFGGFAGSKQRPDRGVLWENAIFNELVKRTELLDEIMFWRTRNGSEVDFVVRRAGRIIGLEVKATSLKRPMLPRAARSFIQAYHPECFGIINASLKHDMDLEGIKILFRRPWELDELLLYL